MCREVLGSYFCGRSLSVYTIHTMELLVAFHSGHVYFNKKWYNFLIFLFFQLKLSSTIKVARAVHFVLSFVLFILFFVHFIFFHFIFSCFKYISAAIFQNGYSQTIVFSGDFLLRFTKIG